MQVMGSYFDNKAMQHLQIHSLKHSITAEFTYYFHNGVCCCPFSL